MKSNYSKSFLAQVPKAWSPLTRDFNELNPSQQTAKMKLTDTQKREMNKKKGKARGVNYLLLPGQKSPSKGSPSKGSRSP